MGAIRDALSLLLWRQESFAYADSYDEASGRYRGLRVWQHVPITDNDMGLLVRPGAARRQIDAEMQVFAAGGHGFGVRPGSPCFGWTRTATDWLRNRGILKATPGK